MSDKCPKCGSDCGLSGDGAHICAPCMAQHILELVEQLEQAKAEIEQLKGILNTLIHNINIILKKHNLF